jgi:hypothetical protein
MTNFRLAMIALGLLVLADAVCWTAKNHPHQPVSPPTAALPSPSVKVANATQLHSLSALTAPAAASAGATPATTAAPGDTEQRLGPFSIGGVDYTVVLRKRKPQAAATQELGDTVVAMEIRDSAANVLYQRRFPYQSAPAEFSDTWLVSAGILAGTKGTGLLVSYDLDSEPSAPEPETSGWYQVFGIVNGKLKPFSGPILVQGEPLSGDATRKQFKTAGPLDAHADSFNFKIWAHHFRLIYPVRVDWSQGKISPVEVCSSGKSGGSIPTCEYAVAPEEERRTTGLTFVQLCPDSLPCDHPERVLLRSDSKVDLVSCRAEVEWSEGVLSSPTTPENPMDDQGGIALGSENVALKVRVDGKEGWTRSEEDFNALGMPFEQ